MKSYAIVAAAVLTASGCTTADSRTTASTVRSSAYDLSAVCLTDAGKPVSEGTTYRGKTCSKADTMTVYPKPKLIWL
ncbi:hypothetical protein [Phyllobacterium sp. K27]